MPVIGSDWNIEITIDDILHAQAADAAVLRRRSPKLVEVAERACNDAQDLIEPIIYFKEVAISSFQDQIIRLDDENYLTGSLVTEHLHDAEAVIVAVCTIGEKLEKMSSSAANNDMTYSFALDAAGSAAADYLGVQAQHHFETLIKAREWEHSIPINPGMIGWPLLSGQTEIFRILQDINHQVTLSMSGLMTPLKSISLVLGIGPELQRRGKACDYCAFNGRCHYQEKPCPNLL